MCRRLCCSRSCCRGFPWWVEELSRRTITEQGKPLQQLLEQHSRLHIEHFPSYAPELNPDEGVWSLAKRVLANSCPNDLEDLVEDVIRSVNGIRSSTQKLRGCIVQSELPSFLR